MRLTMKVTGGRRPMVVHREIQSGVTQSELERAADEAAERLSPKTRTATRLGADMRNESMRERGED